MGDVTPLCHEARNDAMKLTALEAQIATWRGKLLLRLCWWLIQGWLGQRKITGLVREINKFVGNRG